MEQNMQAKADQAIGRADSPQKADETAILSPAQRQQRLQEIEQVIAAGPYTDSWDSLEGYQAPSWYQDGKFGIFIHWGVYSVPAFGNEWYPRNMYRQGSAEYEHHRKVWGSQDVFGYKDFVPLFKAERFDADEWAGLFQESGARFVVPVAEHHDGFQMYDSELCRWNAVRMGPCRDVLGELGEACRARDMVLGASSHRAEHWFFMGGGREFPSDVQDPAFADFYGPAQPKHNWDNYVALPPDQDHLEDWLLRTCELIDRYQPQILWFDWWIMNLAFKSYLKKLAAYYYNRGASWGKGVAINYKYDAFPTGVAVFDIERGQLSETRSIFWQTDTAVQKNSWGYTENQDYKTTVDLIGDLVDIVSKNGALLLNIGPKADGTIPEPEKVILREIGAWLKTNGEAIYGTRPWLVSGEGPTRVHEGAFTDTNRAPYQPEDVRYTAKGSSVYAILMANPRMGTALLKKLASQARPDGTGVAVGAVKSVTLLEGQQSLVFDQKNDGLQVQLPAGFTSDNPIALRIDF